jgi:hypothetical protein
LALYLSLSPPRAEGATAQSFCGGLVGYCGYEMKAETLSVRGAGAAGAWVGQRHSNRNRAPLADLYFVFASQVRARAPEIADGVSHRSAELLGRW